MPRSSTKKSRTRSRSRSSDVVEAEVVASSPEEVAFGASYPYGWSLLAWENWANHAGIVYWNGLHQCVALVESWVHNLKLPSIPCQYAYQMYANANGTQWIKIPNRATTVPRPGDIAVWHENWGSAGHVAVVRLSPRSTASTIYSIDQNFSRPGRVSLEAHHYTSEHIIGFLRKR
jgi:hypothetical protein